MKESWSEFFAKPIEWTPLLIIKTISLLILMAWMIVVDSERIYQSLQNEKMIVKINEVIITINEMIEQDKIDKRQFLLNHYEYQKRFEELEQRLEKQEQRKWYR